MAVAAVAFEILLFVYTHRVEPAWHDLRPSIWAMIVGSIGLQEGGALPNPCVNNPTWYIGVLFICYGVFYGLTRLAGRWKVKPVYLYAGMVLLGLGISTYGINLPFLQEQAARGYRGFFFGLILAFLRTKERGFGKGLTIASMLSLAGWIVCFLVDRSVLEYGMPYLLTFVIYPSIVILCETPAVKRLFRGGVWGRLGAISFNVYIWHIPLILACGLVIRRMGLSIDLLNWRYMLLYLVGAELCGLISHFFIERPASAMMEKKIKNRQAAQDT